MPPHWSSRLLRSQGSAGMHDSDGWVGRAYLKIVIGRIGWVYRCWQGDGSISSSQMHDLGIDPLLVVLAFLQYTEALPDGSTLQRPGFLSLRNGGSNPGRRYTYLRYASVRGYRPNTPHTTWQLSPRTCSISIRPTLTVHG